MRTIEVKEEVFSFPSPLCENHLSPISHILLALKTSSLLNRANSFHPSGENRDSNHWEAPKTQVPAQIDLPHIIKFSMKERHPCSTMITTCWNRVRLNGKTRGLRARRSFECAAHAPNKPTNLTPISVSPSLSPLWQCRRAQTLPMTSFGMQEQSGRRVI